MEVNNEDGRCIFDEDLSGLIPYLLFYSDEVIIIGKQNRSLLNWFIVIFIC
jgi:hypothetical protein